MTAAEREFLAVLFQWADVSPEGARISVGVDCLRVLDGTDATLVICAPLADDTWMVASYPYLDLTDHLDDVLAAIALLMEATDGD